MEENKILEKASEKKASQPKKKNVLKKLDLETGKTLAQLKERANKKSFGRKIRDSELISLGLSLITSEHLAKLQEQTYSENDRLHLAHEDYVKNNGRISLDHFIGLLIRGEISPIKKESA
ncbi:MAG: hypothetical protein BroJett040_07960 [Oligoflexia bacterium]|nr:MAG: hypothetical protein BroJett040_07960 [Oligoflexia bacterium]